MELINVAEKLKKTVMVDLDHTLWLPEGTCIEWEEEGTGSIYPIDEDTHVLAFDSFFEGKRRTTTIKTAPDKISIVSIDPKVHSRQVFAIDEWYAYQQWLQGKTGGSLVCRNFCRGAEYSIDADGGVISLKYETWTGESLLCYRELDIYIQ